MNAPPGRTVPPAARELARGLLALRPVSAGLRGGHWSALHRHARDPVVTGLNGYPPTPYPAWMFRWLVAADARRADRRIWALLPVDRPETCLGLVELYDIDMRSRRAVLGIVIGEPEWWGRGLGGVAVELVCEFGFDVIELAEIRLSTYSHNLRARRCFARAGFVETGRGPGPGGREDVNMRLERSRWVAGRAQPPDEVRVR